jgi:hypothetical protein
MKLLIKLFLALLPIVSFAQYSTEKLHTAKAPKYILTPDSLARQLTADYNTDREKVTSIFRWITENISYNIRPFYNASRNRSTAYSLENDDDTGALKPLSERVAIDVLNRRIAFCDGYARLFKTLCDYAGIKSEVITGYAASNMGRAKFSSNHRWNAVFLDSTWQLLDPTWASGHLTYSSNDFIHSYNNHYFLTPAKDFAADHYPEDLQWTLLPEPPYRSEFRHSPFKTHGCLKYNVISYKPQAGVIEASVGDTIQFELETLADKKQMHVLDSTFVDSVAIATAASDTLKNTATIVGDKATCKYIVTSAADKWLTVVMNDEVMMRYKLNVRKNETASVK